MSTKNLEVTMIELNRLRPSPTQPRKRFDSDKHKELVESLRVHGFTLSAMVVRPWPGDAGSNGDSAFEIVGGERRWRAASELKMTSAPCFIRTLTDQETIELQLIDNLQREDLTPIEEAESYKRILSLRDANDKPLYTVASLAQKIGKSVDTIQQRAKLADLGPEEKREVEAGRLSPWTAILIARIPNATDRTRAARMIMHPQHEAGPLSYRKAEELIHREFIRDLRAATFPQEDPELVPVQHDSGNNRTHGGACTDCPFKSGSTPKEGRGGAFSICRNPACYELKEEAHWGKWQEAETNLEKKRRALGQSECEKLYPKGNQLAPTFDLVDLSDRPDGSDLRAGVDAPGTWRHLTQGAELPVIVARDAYGKTHELVERSAAIEAASTINKHAIFKTSQREKTKSTDRRKVEEHTKESERELNKAVLIACADAVKKNVSTKTITDLLRLLIDREIEHSQARPDFLKRHGLPIGGAVSRQLSRRPLAELAAMLVEYVISEGGYMYESNLPDVYLPWLKPFGVDYKAIVKKLSSSAKAIPKAKKKK